MWAATSISPCAEGPASIDAEPRLSKQSLTEQLRPLFGVNGVVCLKKEKRQQKNHKKVLTRAGIVRDAGLSRALSGFADISFRSVDEGPTVVFTCTDYRLSGGVRPEQEAGGFSRSIIHFKWHCPLASDSAHTRSFLPSTQHLCMPCCNQLFYQMRCGKIDKLPWGYDLCFLPESRKMFLIAGHQIVRTRGVRAFQE
jgi:hypothetical protein